MTDQAGTLGRGRCDCAPVHPRPDGLAVIAGLSAKTLDGAIAFSYPLILLPFISSAFVRTENMPGPVIQRVR